MIAVLNFSFHFENLISGTFKYRARHFIVNSEVLWVFL